MKSKGFWAVSDPPDPEKWFVAWHSKKDCLGFRSRGYFLDGILTIPFWTPDLGFYKRSVRISYPGTLSDPNPNKSFLKPRATNHFGTQILLLSTGSGTRNPARFDPIKSKGIWPPWDTSRDTPPRDPATQAPRGTTQAPRVHPGTQAPRAS